MGKLYIIGKLVKFSLHLFYFFNIFRTLEGAILHSFWVKSFVKHSVFKVQNIFTHCMISISYRMVQSAIWHLFFEFFYFCFLFSRDFSRVKITAKIKEREK